jgi:carbon storage regulator
MLTLTRKPGESIHIGDDIEVVVKEIRGGAVRLGIQAPADIFIYRGELYRKIHQENVKAAGNEPGDLSRAESLLDKERGAD